VKVFCFYIRWFSKNVSKIVDIEMKPNVHKPGKLEDALTYFDKAIKINPKDK